MIRRIIDALTPEEKARFRKWAIFIASLFVIWFVFKMGSGWGRITADHPVVIRKELTSFPIGSVQAFGVSNMVTPIDGAANSHTFTDEGHDSFSFSGSIDTLWIYSESECSNKNGMTIEFAPAWRGSERKEICVLYGTYLAISTLDNSYWDPEQNQLNGFLGQEWVQIKVERRPPPTATPQPTATSTSMPAAVSTGQSK